ncbi:protocadherin 2 gamma 28 isoform X10 [Alosa sapidissima]|uniref:protocadherin 2 gamma 28 isoform X10 n=1 Tax=Alosa sapidissima TaxID=34773 RepID=UPI001C08A798|nr:protocadherin 2 gamma 28 isoform X10 [Alosa sapidissima]
MDVGCTTKHLEWSAHWFLLFSLLWNVADAQTRYSVPEESKKGSVVGNLAKDLSISFSEISSSKLSIASENGKQYFSVDFKKGDLIVNERIDRESLCGQSSSCVLPVQVVIEEPLQLYRVEVDIQDINDNSPEFHSNEHTLNVAENTLPGSKFPLEVARDADVGTNALKTYVLSKNEYFSLNIITKKDGSKIPELVLDKTADREKEHMHSLILKAVDGGSPPRSGTTHITIKVLDVNDNAPVFEKSDYEIRVSENAPNGTKVLTVRAVDLDEGINGEVIYSFGSHTQGEVQNKLIIDPQTGDILLNAPLDYEDASSYQFDVRATDKGVPVMEGHSRVRIDIVDVNDNAPEVVFTSPPKPVREDAAIGTVIALISTKDADAGDNGKVTVKMSSDYPFKLKPSFSDHYALVTDAKLDREEMQEYSIELIAVDSGSPPLSSNAKVRVSILDVNDNPPSFTQPSYTVYVKENSEPGKIIAGVSAVDPDTGENAMVSYSILDSKVQDVTASSHVYINSDNGSIFSLHSFDYERLSVFQIRVQASDQGSPSLSSNVTVHVFILDENDNAPAIIYPSTAMGSLTHQKIPRSAKAGHLVTKVTAVDADSGHNAWMSYKLAEATDESLFSVNVYTGEVRTRRAVSEEDDSAQTLLVEIRDNGVPAQSATATVSILLEDGTHEPVLDLRQKDPEPIKKTGRITFYLIVSLAAVSVLSLVTFFILLVRCARHSTTRSTCCMRRMDSDDFRARNLQLQLNTDGPIKYVEVLGGDMLSHSQSFRSCLSPLSEFSDFTFVKPSSTLDFKDMISVLDASLPDNAWTFESQQQKPPNQDWRFNQNQRPGPSGAAATPEVAVGTGPWPNPPTEAEQLQALMAAANGASHTSSPPLYSSPRSCLLISEVSEATNTLTPGTMGLSTRYSPQFTLQHVPDYRQNVYIPGSTATLTSNPQQQQQQQLQLQQQMLPNMPPQQALPPAQATGPDGAAGGGAPGAQSEPPKAAQTPASKKKSTKKEKK